MRKGFKRELGFGFLVRNGFMWRWGFIAKAVVINGSFTRGWFSCDRLFVKAVGSSGFLNTVFGE